MPNHRTPVPESLLKAMASVALLWGYRWAGATLLAYYGIGRMGEVLKCRRHHLLLASDLVDPSAAVFLKLDYSKTAARGRPRVQHLRIDHREAALLIKL